MNDRTDPGPAPTVKRKIGCIVVAILIAVILLALWIFMGPAAQSRERAARNEKRVADLQRIKVALEKYLAEVGPLPAPSEYGEAGGAHPGFWKDWWDVSATDGDGDKVPFLDFLVETGILPAVPVDPVNKPGADGDARGGKQYVYFIVPAGYDYAGGTCEKQPNRWHYMIAITDLEGEASRPPATFRGSGCSCLWRDQPNYFQRHFDYVLCGSFEATPESIARRKETHAKRAAAREEEQGRAFLPQDQKRVADLLQIQQGIQKYLREVGPLPEPSEYGEAEGAVKAGFWQGYWDISTHDGDGDGIKFLDFLVDSGTMPSVPVDPENAPNAERDPRTGTQYVYMLVSPDVQYSGGSCGSAKKEWVYLLGITDLRSQSRPPRNIAGSGCDCLWKDQPNWFQQHFDYVVCGTFEATPESRARAAAARAQKKVVTQTQKQSAAAQTYGPQDQRRIADLKTIEQALKTYMAKVGPLPTPSEYQEAQRGSAPGFWQQYWDVSTEDGDGDGRPFLDFLVESGTLPSVPVDPVNKPGDKGDPKGGSQYVYFVAPPTDTYGGGTCGAAKKEWVYMLAITDLQGELTRPPKNVQGSGCECLWQNQPNYFQQHFDYVTCGTFRR
ncbi:MAG TPA: hypothetical protein VFV49_13325 [Thermoanaerobaculia bacterium]|nr:hypothetical protein [Thermoanaerobaculia bacterium]